MSLTQSSVLILNLFFLFGFLGCGAKTISVKSSENNEIQESIEGRYQAKLFTMNSSLSGLASGLANIQLIGGELSIKIEMFNTPSRMIHAQKIYSATECPKTIHDSNDDGFIDPLEASRVLGGVLIPLDGDLNSQLAGEDISPLSNGLGYYHYYQEAYFSSFLDDLLAPDINFKDDIIKLSLKEKFTLSGKVIVIQGVSEDLYLPGSIQRLGEGSEYGTFPIACGKIERSVNAETATSDSP